jgi:hypothetical protein
VIHEDDIYGSKSDNGSWNGMVGLVVSGVADIGIAGFIVNIEKYEVVAFTEQHGFGR